MRDRILSSFVCTVLSSTLILLASLSVAVASPRIRIPSGVQSSATQQAQQNEQDGAQQRREANRIIGELTWVDTAKGIAILYTDGQPPRFSGRLLARNFALDPTAILVPSGIRQGRAIGLLILQGSPSPGDEVIIPGSAYRELFGERLAPYPPNPAAGTSQQED